jgi:hypothetical protein
MIKKKVTLSPCVMHVCVFIGLQCVASSYFFSIFCISIDMDHTYTVTSHALKGYSREYIVVRNIPDCFLRILTVGTCMNLTYECNRINV